MDILPAYSDEKIFVFLAGCLKQSEQKLDKDEIIENDSISSTFLHNIADVVFTSPLFLLFMVGTFSIFCGLLKNHINKTQQGF